MPVRRHAIRRTAKSNSARAAVEAARQASREVSYGSTSFVSFIRSRAEELGPPSANGGASTRVSKSEADRLVGARNWSALDPRVRKELMARSIREDAESRLAEGVEQRVAHLAGLGDRIRADVQAKLTAKGIGGEPGARPSLPTKPSTRLPKPPPAPARARAKKRPLPPALDPANAPKGQAPVSPPVDAAPPKAPKPVPRPSEPEPPVQAESETEPVFESAIGYFVSLSKVGYYTEEPPVRTDNPVIYDFADQPDGLLRLGPGEEWASPWYEGEILRGMSVDAVGSWRLNFINNGSFEG